MRTVVVLDVVGLTPGTLAQMPRLAAFAERGSQARLDPAFPAVTCTVQSSMLTGLTAAGHGIVGNGWYFRDTGEVHLWRQHNALVQGEKVWDAARRAEPGYRVANVCWWYAMGAATDLLVTPRPIYHADGRKSPGLLHPPAGAARPAGGRAGRLPALLVLGAGRRDHLLDLDRAAPPGRCSPRTGPT